MTLVSGYLVLTNTHGNDRDDDDNVTQHGSHTPADRTWQVILLDIFTMRNFSKLGLHLAKMASGIACALRHIRTATTATTAMRTLHNMVAILQLIGHGGLS